MNPAFPKSAVADNWPALVIFDCDGVLVDSEIIALTVARAKFARIGVELNFLRARDLFVGKSMMSMRKAARTELDVELPEGFEEELAREQIAGFERDLKGGVEGLREALEQLEAPVCVASSSPPDRVASALAIAGFADLFDGRVFSGATTARGKPAPDLFLMAASRLGAPSEACLVIEDSSAGVEAAQRAHMTAFGFVGGSHAVGDEYSERLRAAGASQLFSDMRALPKLIERERAARAAASDG